MIPPRADGSRWIYNPPAKYQPRGKRDPQTAEEMRAKLESIKPHKDPKPRKPETIEAYAARMAKLHALVPVVTFDDLETIHHMDSDNPDKWYRLPDTDPVAIEADLATGMADPTMAEMAGMLADARFAEPEQCAADLVAEGMGPHELQDRIGDESLPRTHGFRRTVAPRPYFGAGAWSRRAA